MSIALDAVANNTAVPNAASPQSVTVSHVLGSGSNRAVVVCAFMKATTDVNAGGSGPSASCAVTLGSFSPSASSGTGPSGTLSVVLDAFTATASGGGTRQSALVVASFSIGASTGIVDVTVEKPDLVFVLAGEAAPDPQTFSVATVPGAITVVMAEAASIEVVAVAVPSIEFTFDDSVTVEIVSAPRYVVA